jgi:broad specificity phosphatase PhoE
MATAMRRPRVTRIFGTLIAVAATAVLAACGTGTGSAPVAATEAPAPTAAPETAPRTPVIMIIRHAEKPDGTEPGVDEDGDEDDSSLTPTGWDRARRLVDLFHPAQGSPPAGLTRPTAIYAAGATDDGEGQRTRETGAPLADALGLPVSTDYGRGDEKKLVKEIENVADTAARPGVTLISWQHSGIPEIVDDFANVTPAPPQEWPENRFDVVWVLTRTAEGWRFTQVPELVLPQDSADPIEE